MIKQKKKKKTKAPAQTPKNQRTVKLFNEQSGKNEEFIEESDIDNLSIDSLKETARKRKKTERFIKTRMWLSLIVSAFNSDRGTIPKNIGNNILITNNQYTTKNHLAQMIIIQEMSEYTPLMWMSDLLSEVKDAAPDILVDITVKAIPYYVDVNASGMNSRLRTWNMTLDNPLMGKESVRRASRCLFSYDIIKGGAKVFKGYTYVIIRATTGAKLRKGVEQCCAYLGSIGATYKKVNNNIEEHMQFVLAMCDKRPAHMKDLNPVIYSTETLAQSLPGIQGMNNTKGVLFGFDIISNYPYFIDFKASANAKNVMIEANSGFGKTYMAESWLYPFYADGFNICVMDIKGTEFRAFTQALHGVTISMRNDTPYYINTFVWDSDEKYGRDPKTYANHQLRLSKEKMLIMADLSGDEASMAEALVDEFLQNTYELMGARVDNENTWTRTRHLTPYIIFEYFERYISHEIQNKYPKVAKKVLERLRIYMSRGGSNSHIFGRPFAYRDVLDNRVLTFDFGILEESSDQDPILFKLHVLDMTIVNDSFVSHKKDMGQWTVKVLEESQIVDDYLTRIYTREITLRRAQNQVTILLGNSIAALYNNPLSRPILDNLNILAMGAINKASREFLINDFGLKDDQNILLQDIQSNSELNHTFLLVNRMEQDSTTALLQAAVPDDVRNSSLFRVVDTEE